MNERKTKRSDGWMNRRSNRNITIAIKSEVMSGLSIDIFTFDLGPRSSQGHAHFHCKYLINNDDKHYYYCHITSHIWTFGWHNYIQLTLADSKSHTHFKCEFIINCDRHYYSTLL